MYSLRIIDTISLTLFKYHNLPHETISLFLHDHAVSLYKEAGISGRDKQWHPTGHCGMQLLIPAWDTCFWHRSPHLYPAVLREIFNWSELPSGCLGLFVLPDALCTDAAYYMCHGIMSRKRYPHHPILVKWITGGFQQQWFSILKLFIFFASVLNKLLNIQRCLWFIRHGLIESNLISLYLYPMHCMCKPKQNNTGHIDI